MTLRVDTGAPPLRLLRDAEEAGPPVLGTSVGSLHPPPILPPTRGAPWDELRVWGTDDLSGA